MTYKLIFVLLAIAMPALYLDKAGFSTPVLLAFLMSFIPIWQNRASVFSRETWQGIKQNKLLLLLVLFFAAAGYSSFTGIEPDYSVKQWLQIVGVAFVGVCLYTGLSYAKPQHFEKFLQYCYWTLGFFTLWALFDHLNIYPPFTEFVHGENPRLTKFSSVVAIVLPFALSHTLIKHKKAYWLVPFLAVAASFACGGRSGWVALVIGFITLYLLYPWETVIKKKLNRLFAKLSLFVGAGVGLYIHLLNTSMDKLVARVTLASPKGAGSGRLPIWEFAYNNYLDHPIWGIGVKGFRKLDFTGVELASIMHPHNAVLEILLETGAVGLLLALAFVAVVVWRLGSTLYQNVSFKNPIFHVIAIASFSAFVAYGTASLTLTSIFHAYWLGYFVILVILLEVSRKNILMRQKEDYTQEAENKAITATYPCAVSVIMPCHNSEKYLASAIESVLAQTYQNWELIIANNGSTDNSLKIAQDYAKKDKRIKVVTTDEGLGVGLAKNMGVEHAKGRYVAFLDSDDKWTPNKLEVQVNFMEKTGAPLSGTHYYVINENDKVTGSFKPSKRHVSYYSLLKANDIGCLTSMYDTHQLGKMYMTAVKVGSDLFLWLEMLKKKPFAAIIHKPLGYYRIHDEANTKNKNRSIKMRWQLIFSEKEVGYLRGFYYFTFYAFNGFFKAIRGRFGKRDK